MGLSFRTTTGKILASAALIGTAAAVSGFGTYGGFTDSTSADQNVATGTTDIALNGGSLTDTVTGLLPGDAVEKLVTLSNAGDSGFNAVTLTTELSSGATANLLTSDAANGLQLTIESCSVAWTPVAGAADTCAGAATTVLATTRILGTGVALNHLASLSPSASDNLKITTSLPVTAGNSFQGLTSNIQFTFDATQRTGTVD